MPRYSLGRNWLLRKLESGLQDTGQSLAYDTDTLQRHFRACMHVLHAYRSLGLWIKAHYDTAV